MIATVPTKEKGLAAKIMSGYIVEISLIIQSINSIKFIYIVKQITKIDEDKR
jgi:hypothetical protein